MGAPPTKAGSAIKALTFVSFLFGVEGGKRAKSPRVNGAAWAMFVKKKESVGRYPFTVAQVRLLQTTVVEEGGQVVDRLFAGLTCSLVARRLRYADAQRSNEEPSLDVVESGYGFLEVPSRTPRPPTRPGRSACARWVWGTRWASTGSSGRKLGWRFVPRWA